MLRNDVSKPHKTTRATRIRTGAGARIYKRARYIRISIGLEDEAARGHAGALEPPPQQTYEERLLLKEERKIRIRRLRQALQLSLCGCTRYRAGVGISPYTQSLSASTTKAIRTRIAPESGSPILYFTPIFSKPLSITFLSLFLLSAKPGSFAWHHAGRCEPATNTQRNRSGFQPGRIGFSPSIRFPLFTSLYRRTRYSIIEGY